MKRLDREMLALTFVFCALFAFYLCAAVYICEAFAHH